VGAPFRLLGDSVQFELIHADVLDALNRLSGRKFRLIISSPPYNIGKSYERCARRTIKEYAEWQSEIARKLFDLLEENGSICWQVGNFVKNNEFLPLDFIYHDIFSGLGLKLRNRIIWKFNFGRNADRRFSGRYETLLWYTKSDDYLFNLDPVRIPQLYPGKRHSSRKGIAKAGLPSGNPLGKNPSDYWEFDAHRDFIDNPVWDIPNVKANHVEKTIHPCQFPIELAERCVLAFSNEADSILDPFVGTGSSVIAAIKLGRLGVGIDKDESYLQLARDRLDAFGRGELRMRQIGSKIGGASPNEKVRRIPEEWLQNTKI
jgi:DNA modification methylase